MVQITCPSCGSKFDSRGVGDQCPFCGVDIKKLNLKEFLERNNRTINIIKL